jgi:hypothetical protein
MGRARAPGAAALRRAAPRRGPGRRSPRAAPLGLLARAAVANVPQPQPLKGFPPAVYAEPARTALLQAEGATYAWLWQALRNL